jgi:hypothetical protein
VKVGWQGSAVRFTNSFYIRTTANQNTNFPTKSMTMELWFYPRKAGVLASETSFNTLYDRAMLEVLPSGSVQAGLNGLTAITLGDAAFNSWNHVALRYDVVTQTLDGFLNGVKSSAHSTGTRTTPVEKGLLGYFAFGRTATTKLGTGDYFGGEMDDIRVWNVARTDAEITSSYHRLLAGDEDGLILYWRFDNNTSNTIFDYSRNNNRGTLLATTTVSTAPLAFEIQPILLSNASTVSLQFQVVTGARYLLQSSFDLTNWSFGTTMVGPTSGILKTNLPLNINVSQFFRLTQ